MTTTVSNSEDVIDSREIIARIEELEEQDELSREAEDGIGLDEDEAEELKALKALQDEAEGYAPDWKHGATLIRDSYFARYAEELADDIGAIDRNASWPMTCIDWERAARELQMDYTSVDFDGVTYWVR